MLLLRGRVSLSRFAQGSRTLATRPTKWDKVRSYGVSFHHLRSSAESTNIRRLSASAFLICQHSLPSTVPPEKISMLAYSSGITPHDARNVW